MTAIASGMAVPNDGAARIAGRPQALAIIVTNAMPILAVASLVPSLPLMLRHFAAVPGSGFLVPMILTIPTLCLGVLSSVGGLLADRLGRRPVLIAALAVFTAAGVAPLFVDDLHTILAIRVLVGLAEACIPTSGNALLGDYFEGDERRQWISLEMVLGPCIGSIMVLAGGYLGTLSWRAPFLLYGVGAIPLLAVYLYAWEPRRRAATLAAELTAPFPWRRALLVGACTLIGAIPFFSQNTQHGRVFAGLGVESTARIGLYATIASIGTMVGAYFYRRYRFATVAQALALSFGCFAVSFVGLSLRPTLAAGVLIDGIGQFAGGLTYTAILAWAVGSFPERYRARGIGIWASAFYLGSFLSTIVVELVRGPDGAFLDSLGRIGAIYGMVSLILVARAMTGRRRAPGLG